MSTPFFQGLKMADVVDSKTMTIMESASVGQAGGFPEKYLLTKFSTTTYFKIFSQIGMYLGLIMESKDLP